MKLLIKVLNFTLVTFLAVSCQKTDDDEGKPYEFGFTIDGEQHRHEKKDVNGIIQGEFGFITADGVYHVTVYATDENGNFKILSMRNIRISAPLDGSPLPPGAKIESSPYSTNHKRPQTPAEKQPQSQQQNLMRTTSRPRTTFVFTTQPTIKPACGGCGYVTTPKPRAGQPFPFQTPSFQKPIQKVANLGSNYPNQESRSQNNYPYEDNQQSRPNYPNAGPNYPESNSPTNYPNSLPNYSGSSERNLPANYPNAGPNYPGNSESNLSTNYPNSGQNYPDSSKSNFPTPASNLSSFVSNYPTQTTLNSGSNDVQSRPRRPLSQVTVSNGAIHVPGNPDIPIRDKYPGMVDGLPSGITEKDITDLLYKFNYTVGFHGHYEKGLKSGAKVGGYFVTGRDGISRIVTYVADENGFRPKVKFVRLDLNSDEVPKEGTEKKFGLKNFEFIWYPIS